MSANNFENNVQQKLDELRLRPSEQVWLEVERRIREKKRRRIIFWFLFPGLLLLGGGAWWMMNQPAEKNMAVTETSVKNNIETPGKNKTETIEKNKVEKKDGENKTTTDLEKKNSDATTLEKIETVKSNEPEKKAEPVIVSVYHKPEKPIVKKQVSASEILKQLPVVNDKNIESILAATDNREPKTVGEIKNGKNNVSVNADVSIKEIKSLPEKKTDIANIVSDTLIAFKPVEKNNTEIKSIESIAIATDSLVKPTTAETTSKKDKTKKSKWEIGVTANIGTTRLYDKGLINLGMKSADLAFSSPSTGSGTGGGPLNNSVYADSIPLKGFAWQAGIFAKRKTGKKISYSVGLNISYYSTNQVVGVFVDSVRTINNDLSSRTAGGFYRYGGFNSYKNKYYYIQTPLLLQWQINKGKKLPPLILENGFSPLFMFASKALVYDKRANLFFTDKRLYNKFSVLYHTAFDVKLFSGKNHPLTAGFFYDFHISRLQKVSPPDYNYLQSFGLKINYMITPALKLQSTRKK